MPKNKDTVRFYLDQNIIDYLIKGKLDILSNSIKGVQNSEIIYSYVTLAEFFKINDDSQRKLYLDFLKDNNAKYFWIDNNELAHFEDVNPYEQYNLNQTENPIYNNLQNSMLGMLHKLLGGKKDMSFDEIGETQKQSFCNLMDFINKNLDSIDNNFTIDKEYFKNSTELLSKYFNGIIDDFTNQLKNNNTLKDDPFSELRKLLEISVVELNNIKLPNIIPQIWDRIKNSIERNKINLSYDDLFGDGILKYYSNQKITMTMKVNGLYNLLNSLGYHPDKDIQIDKRFYPFMNDHQHTGNAIYSDFFVTRDKRLMKKAEAVYEHLKIGTKIIFVQ